MSKRAMGSTLVVLLAAGYVWGANDALANALAGRSVAELQQPLTQATAEEVRVNAVKALDQRVPVPPARGARVKQAEKPGQEVIDTLIEALKDPSCAVRGYAMKSLARAGAPAVPGLILSLQSASIDVRAYAAGALAEMSTYAASGLPPEVAAVPALTAALQDQDYSVRVAAARALRGMGTHAVSALPKLIGLLQDEEWAVVDEAVQAVAAADPGGKESVPALAKALNNPKHDVREVACNELKRLGTNAVGAIPALIEQLSETGMNWYASKAAAEALVAIDPAGKRVVGPIAESIARPRPSFVKNHLFSALLACQSDFGPEIKPAIPYALQQLKRAAVSSGGVPAPLLGFLRHAGPQAKAELGSLIQELLKDKKLNEKTARMPLEELLKKLEG